MTHLEQTNWYQKSSAIMLKATQEEAKERYGTRTPIFNYRWEHVVAVVTIARKLAAKTGADEEIVVAAAWLHDIEKQTAKQNHPQAGADYARMFLPKTDFPPEKIEAVAQAIDQHMGLWRDDPLENLEAAVLWDADKLAKMGLTAAFHWVGMWFAKGKTTASEDYLKRGRKQDWMAKTAASMHTAPAKRAAEKRLARYYGLWDDLEAELNGDDLD